MTQESNRLVRNIDAAACICCCIILGFHVRPASADPAVLFAGDDTELVAKDKCVIAANVAGFNAGLKPELQIGVLPFDWGLSTIYAHTGNKAIRFSGSANGGNQTFCCMEAFDVNIQVTKTTKLSYWIYPQEVNATHELVDLHCSDGTTLHALGGVYKMIGTNAPSHVDGEIPINTWSEVACDAGKYLAGKTIDSIWIVYDRAGTYGQFRGYIDDLYITDGEYEFTPVIHDFFHIDRIEHKQYYDMKQLY